MQHAEHTRDRGGRRVLRCLASVHCLLSGQRAHLTCNEVRIKGALDRAAATACRWRVRRGRMLADDGLHDTQTAVPRPAAGAQPATTSCALDGDQRARSFLGGVVSASVKASTRWICGRRGSVLPNVALRSVRVSVMLVLRPHCEGGGCKLDCGGAGDGRAVGKGFKTCSLPTASLHPGVLLSSPPSSLSC